MTQPIITLRPLTRADLAAITPWFEDPDTRGLLGGPDWPAVMLDHGERAVGEMFRGAVQIATHHYLAQTNGRAVGYIDCGTFDRCTVYGGEGPDGPIILETIEADLERGRVAAAHRTAELVESQGSFEEGADDVHRPLLLKHLYRLMDRAIVAFSIHLVRPPSRTRY